MTVHVKCSACGQTPSIDDGSGVKWCSCGLTSCSAGCPSPEPRHEWSLSGEEARYGLAPNAVFWTIALCGSALVDSFDGSSASRFAKTLPRLDLARRQAHLFGSVCYTVQPKVTREPIL